VQPGEKVIVSGGLGLDDKAKIKIVAAPPDEEDADEDADK